MCGVCARTSRAVLSEDFGLFAEDPPPPPAPALDSSPLPSLSIYSLFNFQIPIPTIQLYCISDLQTIRAQAVTLPCPAPAHPRFKSQSSATTVRHLQAALLLEDGVANDKRPPHLFPGSRSPFNALPATSILFTSLRSHSNTLRADTESRKPTDPLNQLQQTTFLPLESTTIKPHLKQ